MEKAVQWSELRTNIAEQYLGRVSVACTCAVLVGSAAERRKRNSTSRCVAVKNRQLFLRNDCVRNRLQVVGLQFRPFD